MDFQIRCDCGNVVTCNEGMAGGQVPCSCGTMIPVPSYRELRSRTGDTELAPEFVVQRLLEAGRLPEGKACACCKHEQGEIRYFWVECARAVVRTNSSQPWISLLLSLLCMPIAGFDYLVLRPATEEYGNDVVFRLPLRVCDSCRPTLKDEDSIRVALMTEPDYKKLFEKFRQARVTSGGE